jgi:hypothetical protein
MRHVALLLLVTAFAPFEARAADLPFKEASPLEERGMSLRGPAVLSVAAKTNGTTLNY